MHGMTSFVDKIDQQVKIVNVSFDDGTLHVILADGRDIGVSMRRVRGLQWLADAGPTARAKWEIYPDNTIYWPDLDDGIELQHLLTLAPLAAVDVSETAYLLSNPANAAHLRRSMAEVQAGQVIEHELIER